MTAFDIRTAFLILGVLYLLLPTMTWVVLKDQHSQQIALWCSGGLLAGGGLIFSGLRGGVPEWAAIYIPILMFLLSNFARIQSLRLDLGIPWRLRTIAVAGTTFYLMVLAVDVGLHNAILRAQLVSLMWAGLLSHLAMLAWIIGRDEQSRSARWIAWVYGVVSLTILYRWYSLLGLAPNSNINVLHEGLPVKLFALSVLPASVVGHFCYVGLALDRAMRREIKAAAHQAREEESRRLGLQVAQLDRQRSLGELSASLGHELNQPLTAILTNAQVGQRGVQNGRIHQDQMGEIFEKIIANTQRASQIIERIRGFIRPSESRREKVNLNRLVCEVAKLVADDAISRKVTFVMPDDPNEVWVMGDSVQLSQIVLNVFRNAIEALTTMPLRGIHVSCSSARGRAMVRIQDTGPGFTPQTLAQIGTPFLTTKSTGLGMGIPISRSIAEQHGGKLTFANVPAKHGSGAIVELDLPALISSTP
jgi:signal transduction histidine kinase